MMSSKTQFYDAGAVAFMIESGKPEIRESDHYKNRKDEMLDLTMSCSREEALKWMRKWMSDGITNGDNVEFLAAYDIYRELEKQN